MNYLSVTESVTVLSGTFPCHSHLVVGQQSQENKELQELVCAGLGFSLSGKMIVVLGSVPEPSSSQHWGTFPKNALRSKRIRKEEDISNKDLPEETQH